MLLRCYCYKIISLVCICHTKFSNDVGDIIVRLLDFPDYTGAVKVYLMWILLVWAETVWTKNSITPAIESWYLNKILAVKLPGCAE